MPMPKYYDFVVRKPYKAAERLEKLEEEVVCLRYERAKAGKRAMKAEEQDLAKIEMEKYDKGHS